MIFKFGLLLLSVFSIAQTKNVNSNILINYNKNIYSKIANDSVKNVYNRQYPRSRTNPFVWNVVS